VGPRSAAPAASLSILVTGLLVTIPPADASSDTFAQTQEKAPRVTAARKRAGPALRALFAEARVSYPPGALYLRAFKREGVLELWAGPRAQPLTLVKTYPVCAASGVLGPKRRQGDGQVPEGFYVVDRFNPWSNFHLSLGLDYPNASDRVLSDKKAPGGDVFIHGDCVTIGCIPLQDGPVEEVYLAAVDARLAGAKSIPVHVFPARMDEAGMDGLLAQAKADPSLRAFWEGLRPGFSAFERTRRIPAVRVDRKTGQYVVTEVR
jgi:murein L,D-transpeptidase YafK